YHAVYHERRSLYDAVALRLEDPRGQEAADVRRIDLLELRIMLPAVIAVIGQPVVRLFRRVQNAFVSKAALDRHFCGLREIDRLERFQILAAILHFRFAEPLRVIRRHDGGLCVLDLRKVSLAKQMKLFARVEELNRKCVFIAAKPLDPLSVLRPHLDKAGLIAFARTRLEDDLAQFIGFEIADGRKVRGEAAPEAVDHMAGDATALARKDLLADRRISGNLFRFPAHRTQVADNLPDLVVRKSHRGHCGSRNTVLDDIEKRGVLIAMFEDALVYSRAAPAIAFRAVT